MSGGESIYVNRGATVIAVHLMPAARLQVEIIGEANFSFDDATELIRLLRKQLDRLAQRVGE